MKVTPLCCQGIGARAPTMILWFGRFVLHYPHSNSRRHATFRTTMTTIEILKVFCTTDCRLMAVMDSGLYFEIMTWTSSSLSRECRCYKKQKLHSAGTGFEALTIKSCMCTILCDVALCSRSLPRKTHVSMGAEWGPTNNARMSEVHSPFLLWEKCTRKTMMMKTRIVHTVNPIIEECDKSSQFWIIPFRIISHHDNGRGYRIPDITPWSWLWTKHFDWNAWFLLTR